MSKSTDATFLHHALCQRGQPQPRAHGGVAQEELLLLLLIVVMVGLDPGNLETREHCRPELPLEVVVELVQVQQKLVQRRSEGAEHLAVPRSDNEFHKIAPDQLQRIHLGHVEHLVIVVDSSKKKRP